jgi:sugar phosphate isomerase/epimerase
VIGLGSYAYFWRASSRVAEPMSLIDQLVDARQLGIGLFQICDYAPLSRYRPGQMRDVRRAADDLGIRLQLGTKGIAPGRLRQFLTFAELLEARLVRSMILLGEDQPALEESESVLRGILPAFERQGVTLALETYEQVPTAMLVELVERVASPNLGICLDPANMVAALEHPNDVIEACAPHTVNVHVKDFAFTRRGGWVGFTLDGAPLGTGLLDYHRLATLVRPDERGIDQIVEHWLPWLDDAADGAHEGADTTVRTEREWTLAALAALHGSTEKT